MSTPNKYNTFLYYFITLLYNFTTRKYYIYYYSDN